MKAECKKCQYNWDWNPTSVAPAGIKQRAICPRCGFHNFIEYRSENNGSN